MGTTSIYSALNYIQSNLKAPKNKYNSFGEYHYRNCEDILEGVKPLLQETKTCLVISDEITVIGDHNYIKATATLYSANGEQISNSAFAKEPLEKKKMDSAQITGATSSYARKYALNGLFCIDDTKDMDTDEHQLEINRDTNKNTNTTQTKAKAKAKAPETNTIREKRVKEEYLKSITQQMAIKQINPKLISEYINKTFNKKTSNKLTEDELKALYEWIVAYEVAS